MSGPPRDQPGVPLSREWATTAELAATTGWGLKRARRALRRLHKAGLVDRTVSGAGADMWRISEKAVRLDTRRIS